MTLSLTRRQRKALGKLGAILINLPFVFLIMIPLLYTFKISVMPTDDMTSCTPASGPRMRIFPAICRYSPRR